MFEAFHGKTALIFINVKSYIEQIADYTRRISERRGLAQSVPRPLWLALQKRARRDRRSPEVDNRHGDVLLEHARDGDRRRQRQARGTDRASLVRQLSDPAPGPKRQKRR